MAQAVALESSVLVLNRFFVALRVVSARRAFVMLWKEVAEVVIEALRPIRERYHVLLSDPSELDRILVAGAERARAVADPKVREVKRRVGFVLADGA